MVDQEPGANQSMKHFTSVEKIDIGILMAAGFPSFCFLPQRYARMRVVINEGAL